MRVALIDPSHWHFAMYREGILDPNIEIVGVTDPSAQIAAGIASQYGCPAWPDVATMLDDAKPDFVFAFGIHAHMPLIAQELISRRIPFSIEKPCGVKADDVMHVRRMAETARAFVSVPFHYRISGMARTLETLFRLPSEDFLGMAFRVNAGSPLRYAASSPWLIDPALSGGGCMMNLAHHPIDFILQLTGAEVVEVSAHGSNKLLGLDVEDHALLNLTLSDGTVAVVETGYTHAIAPDSYLDFDISFSHRRICGERRENSLLVRERMGGAAREMATDWVFKTFFAQYARRTLELAAAGKEPIAGLRDLERTMHIIDAAYESLRERTVVKPHTAL